MRIARNTYILLCTHTHDRHGLKKHSNANNRAFRDKLDGKRSASYVYMHTNTCVCFRRVQLNQVECTMCMCAQRHSNDIRKCATRLKRTMSTVCNDRRCHRIVLAVIVVFIFFFTVDIIVSLLYYANVYDCDCISYTGRVCAQNVSHKHAILKCSV